MSSHQLLPFTKKANRKLICGFNMVVIIYFWKQETFVYHFDQGLKPPAKKGIIATSGGYTDVSAHFKSNIRP